MARAPTQKPSNSSSGSIPSSSTLRLSSFKPSEWRVQLISSSLSSLSNSSDSRSPAGPILAGRCYHPEQINQYYCPENSEVFDLGGISDQNFYIKFERILDDHPTYVGIYLDEFLTDHFYIPPTEKWAISKGWQENPQWMYKYLWTPCRKTSRNSRISWDKNPRLVGHIIIRFYHLNEEEMKDLRETYITKRPPKCRYQIPRLNVYAGLDQNPTPISSLSPRKQRLSCLPMKVPYHFIYLRYDDVIRKAYGCELRLQTPYEEEVIQSSKKRKRTPEVKYESESDINHYILQPAPPPQAVKPKPKPKLKPKINNNYHYPTAEETVEEFEFESEPDYRPTKISKPKLIPVAEEQYELESDSDYIDIQPGPAKAKFKPKPKPNYTLNSKSKLKHKLKPIAVPVRRPLPYSDLDRDDTTGVASTSRTTARVRNNNSNNKVNHVHRRERRYDGGSRSHVKRENEDSGDEILRLRRQQQKSRAEPRSQQRVQVQVTRERQQRQQGESEMMKDVNFHMKEIWRILGNEAWKSLFG